MFRFSLLFPVRSVCVLQIFKIVIAVYISHICRRFLVRMVVFLEVNVITEMDKGLIRNTDRNNNPASNGPGTPASSTSTSHSSVEHSTDTSSLPVASDSTVKGAHSNNSTGTESDSVPLKRLKVDKVHKFQTDWTKKWPWLNYHEDNGMTCTLCIKQKIK